MAQQSSAVQGPIRAFFANNVNNAALAAGGEVSVSLTFRFPLPRNYSSDVGGFLIFACIIPNGLLEANVMYVAEIGAVSTTQVTVKVKNVGSAAGANTWNIAVIVFDQTDLIQ